MSKELIEAAKKGDNVAIRMLFEATPQSSAPKININCRDSTGMTALHWAANNGHTETVRLLVKFGADLTIEDNRTMNALNIALNANQTETARLILQLGSPIENKFSIDQAQIMTALFRIRNINENFILSESQRLLRLCRIQPPISIEYSQAIENDNKEEREKLEFIDCIGHLGVGINGVDAKGNTALHILLYNIISFQSSNEDFEYGGFCSLRDKILALLEFEEIDITKPNSDGLSAFELATSSKQQEPVIRAHFHIIRLNLALKRFLQQGGADKKQLAELPNAEPPKAEPHKVEPSKAEPPKAEPPKVEPPKAEPPKAESKSTSDISNINIDKIESNLAELKESALAAIETLRKRKYPQHILQFFNFSETVFHCLVASYYKLAGVIVNQETQLVLWPELAIGLLSQIINDTKKIIDEIMSDIDRFNGDNLHSGKRELLKKAQHKYELAHQLMFIVQIKIWEKTKAEAKFINESLTSRANLSHSNQIDKILEARPLDEEDEGDDEDEVHQFFQKNNQQNGIALNGVQLHANQQQNLHKENKAATEFKLSREQLEAEKLFGILLNTSPAFRTKNNIGTWFINAVFGPNENMLIFKDKSSNPLLLDSIQNLTLDPASFMNLMKLCREIYTMAQKTEIEYDSMQSMINQALLSQQKAKERIKAQEDQIAAQNAEIQRLKQQLVEDSENSQQLMFRLCIDTMNGQPDANTQLNGNTQPTIVQLCNGTPNGQREPQLLTLYKQHKLTTPALLPVVTQISASCLASTINGTSQ